MTLPNEGTEEVICVKHELYKKMLPLHQRSKVEEDSNPHLYENPFQDNLMRANYHITTLSMKFFARCEFVAEE